MSIKPRNFDKNLEQQLVVNGICTQAILDKYTKKEKRYYFNQFYIGSVGRRKHPNDEYSFSIYANERRKHIPKASRFEEMMRDIPLIRQTCNHLAGQWANGYIVIDTHRNIFSECCKAVTTGCGLVDDNNNPYNPPANGIRSIMKDGRKCKIKDLIPNEIALNSFSLKRLMVEFSKTDGNKHLTNQIEAFLSIIEASKSGCLPTTYVQSNGGRLYAEGALNLQNCSRKIRIAALVDRYDIDIENCHYTLLAQMCSRINVPTPYIDHYIRNKKVVRKEIATFLKCSEDMAKEILIALIYGSNLTSYGVLRKLNIKCDEIDIKGSWIDKLAKEITSVTNSVVADYTEKTPGYFKIKNDAGMVKATKCENEKSVRKSKLLAHILQGAESFILLHMISFLENNLVLLQHDGVTCFEPADTDALSEYIVEKTGYQVKFDMEKLVLDLNHDDIGSFEPVNHEEIFELDAA
ncbi:hypothetical protein H0248_08190 [Pectobacterium brasiliense]|uniref:hypothetical protein n=1 Tax=Pectobacterium brasiliense TaxID=180957 RepID=UPI0015DF066D|nr:hypothetical protein [Pectobacterium brasiliense]MBA0217343.1 hypothetical protein [Pectobacterium brasiliense]